MEYFIFLTLCDFLLRNYHKNYIFIFDILHYNTIILSYFNIFEQRLNKVEWDFYYDITIFFNKKIALCIIIYYRKNTCFKKYHYDTTIIFKKKLEKK